MNKTKTINKINNLIDNLIIKGLTKTAEYRRLIKLHYKLTR